MPSDHERRGAEKRKGIDRRRWLKALGIAGTAGLAGCLGGDGGGTETPGQTATSATEATDAAAGTQTPDPMTGTTGMDGTGTPGSPSGAANGTNETAGLPVNGTPEGGIPEVGGTYRNIVSTGPETLNPLYNNEQGAANRIARVLDSGYTFRPGTEYFPLVYDMSSDDSQVWVVNVREGLQFGGDYGELTAEDFVYQITQVQQTDWAGTADTSSWPSEVNVEQTGDYEFQIELPEVNELYPETYDPLLYPIPMGLMQPYVDEQDAQGFRQDQELLELSFTGNLGPYTLESRSRGNSLTFARNDDYYLRDAEDAPAIFNEAPYFEGLETLIVQEQSSRLAALRAGEGDAAAIPPNRVSAFRDLDRVDVYVQPQPFNEVCVYNMRDNGWNAGPGNLFREQSFRQGLGCAVDKQRLVTGVFRDFADVEYTWQPRWSRWYPDDGDIMQFGTGDLYGPEATRSRIEEAISDKDYSYNGETLQNPDGQPVELSLYHSAGQNTERAMASFIAQEFQENAGITVNVTAIQGQQFAENYWNQQIPDNPDQYEWSNGVSNAGPREVTSENAWDMTVVFGLNTYPLNPTTANVFFIRDSFYNPYGYYPSWNAKELFEQANNATSTEELQSIFTEIFQNIAEDQPMGMLAFPSAQDGYSSGIVGPQESFFSGWDSAGWYRSE